MFRKTTMGQQSINGKFLPSTVDEKNRTIEVVMTTGQAGKRYNYYDGFEYIEELDVTPDSIRTERLDKGLSVIDNHNIHDGIGGVFGITENYIIENGKLIGTARFAEDKKSDVIFNKIKDGILRHVSLGYTVHKFMRSKGETDKLDTLRAIDWTPNELSFTPVSFETQNGTRGADRELNVVIIEDENIMLTKEQKLRLEALTNRSASLSADETLELAKLRGLQDKVPAPAPPAPAAPVHLTQDDVVAAVRSVMTAPVSEPAPAPVEINVEDVRKQERANLNEMLSSAAAAGFKPEFAQRSFQEGVTVDKFRAMIFEEMAKDDSEFIIQNNGAVLNSDNRNDASESLRNDAAVYIMQRNGMELDNDTDVSRFNGLTLFDLSRHVAESNGENLVGLSRMKQADRAFHAGSDFPLILENVMHKSLNAAYQQTPQTFTDLGDRVTVSDFRDQHSYTLGDAPKLLPLNENGEYKGGSLSEAKEKYRISTFARKIGFSRQMLINDDMNALTRVPASFGQAGANLESDIVWGLLLNYDFFTNQAVTHLMSDGNPLYHASHGNVVLGQAFGEDALSDIRKLGRKQKTLDGNFMNITFQSLVIPEDLETAVEKVLLGNISAITSQTVNPFTNKLLHRVEPRLGAISPTDYYAFSNQLKAFDYAYLAGEENMMTEINTKTDIDGLEVKVRKDFGAGLKEYRGTVKGSA